MNLFGGTISKLDNTIDYAAAKNKAISNNIANADTPGYKAQEVVFKDTLSNAVSNLDAKRTHEKHIAFGDERNAFVVRTKGNTTYNHNGNNVDMDKEMTDLATNQIHYNALIDRINGKFGSISTVLRGGN